MAIMSWIFPDFDPVTDVGMSMENLITTDDTQVIAVEYDGNTPIGQVYTSTRYDYFGIGHTLADSYANKHVYQPVGSQEAVINSSGETYWQDTANDLVWIKVQGGVAQEWNPADFDPEDDELLYWEIYLRITNIQNSNPLPIELLDFSATLQSDNTVRLDWTTASEINNDHFEIQRSENGDHWDTIGTIEGQGNSPNISRYSFNDQQPLDGRSYYRLKQVDIDGKFTYSKIESVRLEPEVFHIYPNPAAEYIKIDFAKAPDETWFSIIDINGNTCYPIKLIDSPETKVDISTLSNGMYFIRISDPIKAELKSFIKY